MWLVGVRDLQYRRRRFLIAVVATSVVFAMTVLMSGLSNGLDAEVERIVASFRADSWVVADGASGPFTASRFISADDVERVQDSEGVEDAAPMLVARATIGTDTLKDVNLIGYQPGTIGAPEITEGRAARGSGEVVVDDHLSAGVGDRINVSGQDVRVVGTSDDLRYNFGVNTVFMPLGAAQDLAFSGQPLSSAIVVRGRAPGSLDGLRVLTNDEVAQDLRRPAKSGKSTIDIVSYLLWVVAAGIIASIVYLTALERTRDYAVLKATGSSNATLFGALLLQSIALSLAAAVVAVVLAQLLAPLFPFRMAIDASSYLLLAVLAVVVGTLASVAGLRRAVGVDPALAFGGRVMTDLVVRDLTMEYASGGYKVRPIDSLDLDISTGHLVLLLGASGCGKTTLLSMLARLLTPTSGTIHFGDTEVTALSGRELVEYRRRTVGIVFQAFNLIPSLTARENVQVALQAAKVPRAEARARAEEVLKQVGLEERMHHRPGDMSGGQQQRVAIARALALDPPLILADEPTAHLDYIQVDGVLQLLRELAAPGRIVIVATHDDRLLPLADGVVELTPRASGEAVAEERVSLAEGEVLFEQGDPGVHVYVVESGLIEIFRRLEAGGDERVAVIEPGSYFGELAPMFGLRRSAGARAVDGSAVVTGMGLRDFRELRGSEATTQDAEKGKDS